jgi:hypothetical protein
MLAPLGMSAQVAMPRLSPPTPVRAAAVPFGRIDYAAIADDGAMAIVDGGNQRIYRFHPDGRLRDSLAARGEGPGEFRAAAGLRFDRAGRLVLIDIRNRRWTVWGDGRAPRGQGPLTTGTPLHLLDGDPAPIALLTDFVTGFSLHRIGGDRAMALPATLAFRALPTPQCVQCPLVPLDGDRWLVAATEDSTYRVVEIDARGVIVRTWRAPATRPYRRTDAEVAAVADQAAMGPAGAAGSPERPRAGNPERFRYPRRIAAMERDGLGRIWIHARHARLPHGAFDVWRVDGSFLGTIPLTEPVRGFAIRGDRLIAWGEDANDESAAWSYRILPR